MGCVAPQEVVPIFLSAILRPKGPKGASRTTVDERSLNVNIKHSTHTLHTLHTHTHASSPFSRCPTLNDKALLTGTTDTKFEIDTTTTTRRELTTLHLKQHNSHTIG
mmetsp:Transcript_18856/g.40590  ORF Transcript_18856/g.40590 Transcript_18856/m.40590 type:complete len:107 (-) Transcript_18856:54-374(-)